MNTVDDDDVGLAEPPKKHRSAGSSQPIKKDNPVSLTDDEKSLLAYFNRLPKHKKAEAIDLIREFSKKAEHSPTPLPSECPPEKTYDHWKVVNQSKDGKQCLEDNWKSWLKAFNPALDRDYMSQADLAKLDNKLLIRLRKQFSSTDLNEYIPSLPSLHTQIAARITLSEIKQVHKKAHIIARHMK